MVWQSMEAWQIVLLAGLGLIVILLFTVLMILSRRGQGDRRLIRELQDELDDGLRSMGSLLAQQSLTQREEQLRTLQGIWPYCRGGWQLPPGRSLLLPQKPYLSSMPLRPFCASLSIYGVLAACRGVLLPSFATGSSAMPSPRMMMYFIFLSLSYVRNRNNVGKNASSGNACPCTIAFDDHRILIVAFGGDHNDVVATFQVVERVSLFYLV